MDITLPLDKMSILDKLRTLETIWDDLLKHPEELPVPNWHGDVLAAREQRIQTGSAQFKDWDEAKQSIRERIK